MRERRLRTVQRQVETALYGGAAVAALISLSLLGLLVWTTSRRLPTLPGAGSPLAEALRWPWEGFPPVALVERETISREFRLDEPLLTGDLRPWRELPPAGALRPASDAARSAIEQALRAIPTDLPPTAAGEGTEAGAVSRRLDEVIQQLSRISAPEGGRWLVLYNRGVLHFFKGNHGAAALDFQTGLEVLQPLLASPPTDLGERAAVYEAAIHTHFALGQVRVRGDGETPVRRREAISSFRAARTFVERLWSECRSVVAPEAQSPLSLSPLPPTGLSTTTLANDLLATYLGSPGFHHCSLRPQKEACPTADQIASDCDVRDRAFCLARARAVTPFSRPLIERFQRFYAGDAGAWADEHLLWALSLAVEITAENDAGDAPYLLYNLGSLLIAVGELGPAAEHLDRALASATVQALPKRDLARITQLHTITRVLAGGSPSGSGGRSSREPSSIRSTFRRLYEDQSGQSATEFPPVGGAFDPAAASLIDNWLFIHFWRTLLKGGEFERFTEEYDRLMSEPGVFKDFFARWYTETMTTFGERALERAEIYEKAGEPDKARLIRVFLSDSGRFPSAIEHQARAGWGWVAWGWRQAWPWLAGALLVLLPLLAFAWARALVRLHRTTFFSAHRQERLGGFDRAYPR